MRLAMLFQVILAVELFVAHRTLEAFVRIVYRHVTAQNAFRLEALFAYFAL